jgi:Coenzyme PQQ synthesis protein D (PqqD)
VAVWGRSGDPLRSSLPPCPAPGPCLACFTTLQRPWSALRPRRCPAAPCRLPVPCLPLPRRCGAAPEGLAGPGCWCPCLPLSALSGLFHDATAPVASLRAVPAGRRTGDRRGHHPAAGRRGLTATWSASPSSCPLCAIAGEATLPLARDRLIPDTPELSVPASRAYLTEAVTESAMTTNPMPKAKTERLIVREIDGETLVYDRSRDAASCLNEFAARVWRECDGETSVAEIAAALGEDERAVWLALHQLTKAQLLVEAIAFPPDMSAAKSRREVAGRLGLGAAALVTSIVAPMPAQAASACINPFPCSVFRQNCCLGFQCVFVFGIPQCIPGRG